MGERKKKVRSAAPTAERTENGNDFGNRVPNIDVTMIDPPHQVFFGEGRCT